MFGSDSRWRKLITGFIGASTTGLPATSTVTVPAGVLTCCPCAAASTSSSVSAIPFTTPAATASVAVADVASWTADTDQSTFRPRAWAIEVIVAIAMLRTLAPSVPVRSAPLLSTGDAAPMLVPVAM